MSGASLEYVRFRYMAVAEITALLRNYVFLVKEGAWENKQLIF